MSDSEIKKPSLAQRLGHAPLVASVGKPAIDVNDPNLMNIARAVVENLPPRLIFRRENSFWTVSQASKPDSLGLFPVNVLEMTPRRLLTWLCDYLVFQKGTGEKAKATQLPVQLADTIMASDPWHYATEELETIIPVRLPVWGPRNEKNQRTITLAPLGYDAATLTYTTETLNYTESCPQYSPTACQTAWNSLMHTFPWGSESETESSQVWKTHAGQVIQGPKPSTNRSACCCLALMLGQYCRLLVNDVMPIGIFNANQRGSGKSLLAWLCVAPVWGMAAGTPDCKNEDEANKALQAALLSRLPYYMLDDIPVLASGTINMIATSNEVAGRRLGGLEFFTAKNKMQIFATGNNIGTSADVERRALICDLFLATDAVKRTFKTPLNKKSVTQPSWRADLLRLMWAMVKNWADAGCPSLCPASSKPTFETFAEIIGSILIYNGFASPFAERRYSGSGGDTIGRTILRLLAHIVSNVMEPNVTAETFKISKIIEIADAMDWLLTITGASKSPAHSLGKRLEQLRGMKLYDENGLPFEFGKREAAGQSSYTFTRIKQ